MEQESYAKMRVKILILIMVMIALFILSALFFFASGFFDFDGGYVKEETARQILSELNQYPFINID